jgi:hypothetical protein
MGIGYKNATLHVQKWNGLFWINYPKIEVESYAKPEDNRMAMCLHNGQLHIAGTFLQKASILVDSCTLMEQNGQQLVGEFGAIMPSQMRWMWRIWCLSKTNYLYAEFSIRWRKNS